ncbi:ORF1308 [White spot syndrome virus]|uniref:ORF1308 n=1 Tax=White spot syndrome virus TaxID=342409 RepID=A0A2D3I6E2_9VIRU|nr:ORF1308 [White spot syndrome virus]
MIVLFRSHSVFSHYPFLTGIKYRTGNDISSSRIYTHYVLGISGRVISPILISRFFIFLTFLGNSLYFFHFSGK